MTKPQGRGGHTWHWAVWTALMVAAVANAERGRHVDVIGLCAREPRVRVDCYPPIAHFPNATEETCLAQGCCWNPIDNEGIPCAFDALPEPEQAWCDKVSNASRIACRNPRFAIEEVGQDADTCRSIGCCFEDGECFQPFFEGYELLTLEETTRGWRGVLVLRRFKRGPFGNDIPLLELDVIKESKSRVRFRITDPSFPRYEVRDEVLGRADIYQDDEDDSAIQGKSDYHVHFYERPFGVAVTRRKTGEVLFNSTPSIHAQTSFSGLVFENQFIELSTHLESHDAAGSPVLFGLGERWGRARIRADRKGDHYPMFSRRAQNIMPHTHKGGDNLGGVHPFYLQILSSGSSHGVYFQSSNAMEVVTQDTALTFRSTGGVIDFFVFSGPSGLDVTSEYTEVVGRPDIPPFWALGYHFGKRGLDSLADSMLEVTRLREAGVPLDSYWQDVDYMYEQEAFSLDERSFPVTDTRRFVDDLHFNNQYYVVLLTPTIPTSANSPNVDDALVISDEDELECNGSNSGDGLADETTSDSKYHPLTRGTRLNVFVKGVEGEASAQKLVGLHWSAFIDFSHPNATRFWREMLQSFHRQLLPFDGVWFKHDEPSSLCDSQFSGTAHICAEGEDGSGSGEGSSDMLPRGYESQRREEALRSGSFVRSTDIAFPFDPYRQPFVPGQSTDSRGGHGNLNAATLPMASLHHTTLHYNLHSLYGHYQAKTTAQVMNGVLKRRSLVLSRASFAGDGQYAGHLSGDIEPTWENLQIAISSVVKMNLFGIPLAGPSVGGHGVGTGKELSVRWHQAASFFPLIRNHAALEAKPQSPIDFDQETANIIRETLLRRYKYFPYLYSLMYSAHSRGSPVVRALALEFPEDPLAFDIETQFTVGSALMVSPCVEERAISTLVYFPNATWFDLESGHSLLPHMDAGDYYKDRFIQLLTPLATLHVHVRGGYIVPTQRPGSTIAMTKRGVYRLIVALEPRAEGLAAEGELFLDDGDSLDSVKEGRYSLLTFEARVTNGDSLHLKSKRVFHGYDGPEMHVDVEEVVVFGLRGEFHTNSTLRLHGSTQHDQVRADYFEQADMLVLSRMDFPVGDELDLRVEAINVTPDVDENEPEAGMDSHGEEEDDDEENHGGEGQGDVEEHGGKHQDKEGESNQPAPIAGEQKHGRKGLSAVGIVGIIVGIIFFAGIIFVMIRNRRQGYSAIS